MNKQSEEAVIEIAETINKYIKENDELKRENTNLKSRIKYETELFQNAFRLASGNHRQDCKCSRK
tara:strand:+ start:440 stop:634 length:195 start_codon:yes stop_codon:yes gene_type:complete